MNGGISSHIRGGGAREKNLLFVDRETEVVNRVVNRGNGTFARGGWQGGGRCGMLCGMKRTTAFFLAAALAGLAAGCASPPPGLDTRLESFTALKPAARSMLASELREPETAVAAVVDVDMRSDPRGTLLRYTPVRFRTGTGELRLHALAPEATFRTVAQLRDAIRKRHAKDSVGIVVFFNGSAAGTPGRVMDEREAEALQELLVSRLEPMLEESKIGFAWIVPDAARLFPAPK